MKCKFFNFILSEIESIEVSHQRTAYFNSNNTHKTTNFSDLENERTDNNKYLSNKNFSSVSNIVTQNSECNNNINNINDYNSIFANNFNHGNYDSNFNSKSNNSNSNSFNHKNHDSENFFNEKINSNSIKNPDQIFNMENIVKISEACHKNHIIKNKWENNYIDNIIINTQEGIKENVYEQNLEKKINEIKLYLKNELQGKSPEKNINTNELKKLDTNLIEVSNNLNNKIYNTHLLDIKKNFFQNSDNITETKNFKRDRNYYMNRPKSTSDGKYKYCYLFIHISNVTSKK